MGRVFKKASFDPSEGHEISFMDLDQGLKSMNRKIIEKKISEYIIHKSRYCFVEFLFELYIFKYVSEGWEHFLK